MCVLSKNDFKIILTEGEMLSMKHIRKFIEFLALQSGGIFQMQNVFDLFTLEKIKSIDENQKHLQILFSGNFHHGHWICMYYNSKVLYIYDSLNLKILNTDQKDVLDKLYPFKPHIVFIKVQQQPNSIDCCLFAVAFATSIYFNVKPEKVVYNHGKMREHLYEMFRNSCLEPFPIDTKNKIVCCFC